MRRFEYFAPQSLDEAVTLLREHGDGAKLVAGGTDLLVQMKEGEARPSAVISLHALPDLRGIQFDDAQGLRIGSGVDLASVAAFPAVRDRYAALAEGAGIVGSVQTRNMGTIGGNIANAAPSADTAPPLLVLDAIAEITGPEGSREVPIDGFFVGPEQTVLDPQEILVAFRLPTPPAGTGSVYRRHTPRKAMDVAVVGVGVRITLTPDGNTIQDARLSLGAVAPTPIRAKQAKQALTGQAPSDGLLGQAADLAQSEASPVSDVRGSAEFRRHLVGVMTRRCLEIALERAKGA